MARSRNVNYSERFIEIFKEVPVNCVVLDLNLTDPT